MSVSARGLQQLRSALDADAKAVHAETQKVMSRAGLQMKRRMQREANGSGALRRVPASIGYDLKVGGTLIEVEVGPEVGRGQGSLAFIGYEGTPTSGPIFPNPAQALEDETSVTERYLERILGGTL